MEWWILFKISPVICVLIASLIDVIIRQLLNFCFVHKISVMLPRPLGGVVILGGHHLLCSLSL